MYYENFSEREKEIQNSNLVNKCKIKFKHQSNLKCYYFVRYIHFYRQPN